VFIIWKQFNIFENIEKLPKFHTFSLQSLNMCTSCHTAHIQSVVNFLPDLLQHIRCYSSQSSRNSILQLLQTPGQWWHVDSVFHIASQDVRSGDLGGHQSNGFVIWSIAEEAYDSKFREPPYENVAEPHVFGRCSHQNHDSVEETTSFPACPGTRRMVASFLEDPVPY
jgi:hypothetical protein